MFVLLLILVALAIYLAWNYFRIRKAAHFVDNVAFKELMRNGQLIDLRSPAEFRQKHILGARNFALPQFKESLSALNKNKPVLLYDKSRGQSVARAILILKKAGYDKVYVLKNGMDYWDGKTK